jgi:antitoxin ParD1/3/4
MPSDRLPPDLESFVKGKCAEGGYTDRGEVVCAALRSMQGREEAVTKLAAAIGRGLADAAEGRVKDGKEVLVRLERKYAAMGKARKA